jgi:hypothetical protein
LTLPNLTFFQKKLFNILRNKNDWCIYFDKIFYQIKDEKCVNYEDLKSLFIAIDQKNYSKISFKTFQKILLKFPNSFLLDLFYLLEDNDSYAKTQRRSIRSTSPLRRYHVKQNHCCILF